MEHKPVLLQRVVELLVPALEQGGLLVDATLGRGGHSRALIQAAPRASLLGIDRDPVAVDESRAVFSSFGDRVRIVRGDFKELASLLERFGDAPVRGVLFDLGVSSPQLDEASRGFSFRVEGPLDMRMDPAQPYSAQDLVNDAPLDELARVISTYGEERFARRIARAIGAARPIEDTKTLAETVKAAIPAATRRTGGHPARRTFQAIRIAVNDEIGALHKALPAAIDATDPGGRIVVLSYHSLEDRFVKRTFADEARGCVCPPDLPLCRCGAEAKVRILTRKPARPGEEELVDNPRASSARLRAVERLASVETSE